MGQSLDWRSTPELVTVAAERFAEAEALVDGDVRLSFADLAAAVRRAAKAFVAAGVAPGDRVGIWAPNVGEWVAAALGVHAAGAVLVPVNTRFKGEEAAWVLGRSGDTGSIEPGKRADLVLLDGPAEHVPYRFGRNPVAAVVLGGELVWVRPDQAWRVARG